MGLDMYLSKKTYVKNWDHYPEDEKTAVIVKKGGKDYPGIRPERVSKVVEEAAYWRKANQIHKWFVDHVQDGVDDCKEYYVSVEQLQELYDTCVLVRDNSKQVEAEIVNGYMFKDGKEEPILEKGKKIVDPSVAEELLPTQSGFFFGGTDYDQYYMQDIEDTIRMLEPLLKEVQELGDNYRGSFYYQSSW